MRKQDGRRRAAMAAVATALVLGAAGCGDGAGAEATGAEATGAETSQAAYAYVGDEAAKQAAAEAGAAAAKKAGDPTSLPADKRIGLILLSGQSASSVRIKAEVEHVAGLLGWNVTTCDPDFDQQKLQQCATSVLAQNPDLIISASQNPTQVASALAEAKRRDIPWFGTLSGGVSSAGFYDYGIEGTDLAKLLDDWLLKRLDEGNAKSQKLLAFTAPTVGASNLRQEEQLVRDVQDDGKASLTVKHDIDLANPAQDVISTTKQTLQQHPDLSAVWTVCDFCLPLISQVMRQEQRDDRSTMIVGTFSTPESIAGVRAGEIDAIAEYPWETQVWVAVDQALEHFARGNPIAPDFQVFDGYAHGFMRPYIIDSANVGKSGPGPVMGSDYAEFFTAKWRAEFGIS